MLKRSGKDLGGQFDYRYAVNVAAGEGVFSCLFRESFAMNVLTVENLARSGIQEDGRGTKVDGFLANLDFEWDAFLQRNELRKAG